MVCLIHKSDALARRLLRGKFLVLLNFTAWVVLLLSGEHSLRTANCLATPKRNRGSAGRSHQSQNQNALSRPRQKESVWSLQENERTIVILYNKPSDIITSHVSQDSRLTVYEDVQSMKGFLPPSHSGGMSARTSIEENRPAASTSFEKATGIRSKLHAIGRLDADTTGLLLLTNDGRLVNYVTNPDAKVQEHKPLSQSFRW